MRPRRPPAAVLLAVAALAAGCGGDPEETNAYVEGVTIAQRSFVNRFEQVRMRLTPTSTPVQDRRTLRDFARITATFATALKRVQPPESVREEHDKLVGAVTGYQRQVEKAEEGLRGGTTEARARARTELSSSVERRQTVIAEAVGAINRGLQD